MCSYMKRNSLFKRFAPFFQVAIVLLLGAVVSLYFGFTVFEYEKQALITRVNNIAKTLDPEIIASLYGNVNDLDNPNYIYLKKKFIGLKSINADARFVYLMGYSRDIGNLFFYVDSESPDSISTYSPPGQVYDESQKIEIDNFLKGVAFAYGPYSDRWGRWVSASAPVISPETNLTIATVGIDVDASTFIRDILLASLPSFLVFAILAAFLFVFGRMRAKDKLNELNNVKMEFTSFMSHEIRGFVTKVKGGLRALLNEEFGILTHDQSDYVKEMINQGDDFADLIEEFLDVGHLEEDTEISLSKADFNLIDIIKNVLLDMKDVLLRKNISVVYEGNVPEKVYCFCDSSKIGRVISNLFTNAIKYSKDRDVIHIGYIGSEDSHTILIKDFGIGIPESEKQHMFKKFFRASNAREKHTTGTGLGLYFSRLIVEKHGGKIWFESREGKGTTFFISLPKEV